jgi:hypothetical protein
VIALLEAKDSEFVNEAAKRGIFAYITDGDSEQLQSSIDVVLRRFAEYHNLEGAFGRRALTERAKGILMERHAVDEHGAFRNASGSLPAHRPQARRRRRGCGRQPPHAPVTTFYGRLTRGRVRRPYRP